MKVSLIVAILIQLIFLLPDYGLLWTKRVVRMFGDEARERSAVYAFGSTFAEYMQFVRDVVPEDGLVIKPTRKFGGEIAHEGIVRYFVMPREIGDCPQDGPDAQRCYLAVSSKAYVLAVGVFPQDVFMVDIMDFIPFEPEYFYRGIYTPR